MLRRVLKKGETLNFLAGLDAKLLFFTRLLADFHVGQSDLVVEVRGCGSHQEKEEADDQQSRAEAQSQRVIRLLVGKEEERESDVLKFFSSSFTGLDVSPSVRSDKRARVNKPLFCTASLLHRHPHSVATTSVRVLSSVLFPERLSRTMSRSS